MQSQVKKKNWKKINLDLSEGKGKFSIIMIFFFLKDKVDLSFIAVPKSMVFLNHQKLNHPHQSYFRCLVNSNPAAHSHLVLNNLENKSAQQRILC